MARTAIPVTRATFDSATPAPAAPIDVANGMSVPSNVVSDRAILFVTNSAAGARSLTVRPGQNPPAVLSPGAPPLVVSVPAGGELVVGPLESARYSQGDGTIAVDFEAGMVGTVRCIELSHRASY
ncbi:MAG: hypothetical protein M3O34_10320 [Chloroflexota bacterium]|nr:hypothetical protein [Chloroflexota bacterium]